jgi:hypothetical protein
VTPKHLHVHLSMRVVALVTKHATLFSIEESAKFGLDLGRAEGISPKILWKWFGRVLLLG